MLHLTQHSLNLMQPFSTPDALSTLRMFHTLSRPSVLAIPPSADLYSDEVPDQVIDFQGFVDLFNREPDPSLR